MHSKGEAEQMKGAEGAAVMAAEMHRGTVVLLTLLCLDEPCYGYALSERLLERGVKAEGNTLYPLLRRLASQGFLEASWDTSAAKPRKYYSITEEGKRLREELLREWDSLADCVNGCRGDK